MGRYQVLFSGNVAHGATESAVRQNLMRRLGLDDRKVAQLFSGRTVVIRSDLTREAADELHAELASLGAIARIKDISPDDKAKFKIDKRIDQTLKDITAAHHECPRCGHMQLESEFCTRCGIAIATAAKQKRQEDLLIERKIKGLKGGQGPGAADAFEPIVSDPFDRIQPIKRRTPRRATSHRESSLTIARRTASMRPQARAGATNEPARSDAIRREPARAEPAARASASPFSKPITKTAANSSGKPFGKPLAKTAANNPFGGGFWRSVFRLGRKDERGQ